MFVYRQRNRSGFNYPNYFLVSPGVRGLNLPSSSCCCFSLLLQHRPHRWAPPWDGGWRGGGCGDHRKPHADVCYCSYFICGISLAVYVHATYVHICVLKFVIVCLFVSPKPPLWLWNNFSTLWRCKPRSLGPVWNPDCTLKSPPNERERQRLASEGNNQIKSM